MDTNGGRWGESGMNLNSGTTSRLISRFHAKTRRRKGGRERRGKVAENQENRKKAGLTTEGHRGAQRGRGKEGGERETIFNIQQGIFNVQGVGENGLWQWQNEKRVLKTQFLGSVVQMREAGGGSRTAQLRIERIFRMGIAPVNDQQQMANDSASDGGREGIKNPGWTRGFDRTETA